MAVVYRHVRSDKCEVFYVGIGKSNQRAYTKHGRSFFWHKVVSKTAYRVDILFEDLTWDEACVKEIELIALYGRKDLGLGTLVNMTDGGTGYKEFTPEESAKHVAVKRANGFFEKLRNRMLTNNPNNYPGVIEKIRQSKLGEKNPAKRPEVKEKISLNNPNRREVVCIEDGKVFNSRIAACRYYKVDSGDIGRHLDTGMPTSLAKRRFEGGLHFKYLNDEKRI